MVTVTAAAVSPGTTGEVSKSGLPETVQVENEREAEGELDHCISAAAPTSGSRESHRAGPHNESTGGLDGLLFAAEGPGAGIFGAEGFIAALVVFLLGADL